MSIILILHNIRSEHNVGSLFRTSDALGISSISLSGYTPTPIDRFGTSAKGITKTALGAEETVPWKKITSLPSSIASLKKDGYTIIAIEQHRNSIDYKKIKVSKKTAFILGNEVRGLDTRTLALCDIIAEIPMRGKKESLNVSVAGAVALFRILNK